MSTVSRREFLAGATAAVGAATLIGRPAFAAETAARIRKGTDLVPLGKSGIKTSMLGVGTGTVSGREQSALGEAGFAKLLREAFDRGVCYIDTAQQYRTHRMVGAALKQLPRDKIFVQTKIPVWRGGDAARTKEAIESCRKDLGLDQLDTVLMHCLRDRNWPTDLRGVIDALQEAKQKGHVRAVGISNHGMGPLAASLDSDFIDVQLVRINPFEINMDGKPDEVAGHLKKIHEKGRGVIGMKIYGETGLKSRQQRLESLKYVLGLGCVDCFTIGFSDIKQIDETLQLIEEAQT